MDCESRKMIRRFSCTSIGYWQMTHPEKLLCA